MKPPASNAPKEVRCAVYTRKSVSEGLEQEFNTLDAQREAAEAFIASQRHEGWRCVEKRYDDGGFTGGNIERPALRELMADVEAGQIDCIVVYKVDRLSRSLLDFSTIMGSLEKHGCSFVSVTQQFNTSHSMGRLTLNILLSFAQFEREIIAERTRDKIHSARKRGKWTGGPPILGYDVAPGGGRLIVNPLEADRVRQLFEYYAEHGSLAETLRWAREQGLKTKGYPRRNGTAKEPSDFSKSSLHALLTNVHYLGKIPLKGEVFAGEHEAIVSEKLWQRVQERMGGQSLKDRQPRRNKTNALLRGLLFTDPDGAPMYHTFTAKGNRRYRYYVHKEILKRGETASVTRSVPAGDIEQFVVERIKALGKSPQLAAEVIRQARVARSEHLEQLEADADEIRGAIRRTEAEAQRLVGNRTNDGIRQLALARERVEHEESRLANLEAEISRLRESVLDEKALISTLSDFDEIWAALAGEEQVRLVELLIQRVRYNGDAGQVSIDFHPAGLDAFIRQAS